MRYLFCQLMTLIVLLNVGIAKNHLPFVTFSVLRYRRGFLGRLRCPTSGPITMRRVATNFSL